MATIAKKARAASERARCAEAAQEEQRAQETLSEARYTSDIAKQALANTEYQGWIFWEQALAATAAFFAACFAGWAAYRAFRAAELTLNHAQESAEAELRPYVFPGEIIWNWMHNPENHDEVLCGRISLTWRNSGQTPAKRVFSASSYSAFGPDGLPEEFNFPDQGAPRLLGSIGPGQPLTHRREMPLADFQAAYKNERRLFFWTWIEYDHPSAERRYRTECCYEILVRNDPTIKESWDFMQVNLTGPFNGSDETCIHAAKT